MVARSNLSYLLACLLPVLLWMAACSDSQNGSALKPAFPAVVGLGRSADESRSAVWIDGGQRIVETATATGISSSTRIEGLPVGRPVRGELLADDQGNWWALWVDRNPRLSTTLYHFERNTSVFVARRLTSATGWWHLYGQHASQVVWGHAGQYAINSKIYEVPEIVTWWVMAGTDALYGLSATQVVRYGLSVSSESTKTLWLSSSDWLWRSDDLGASRGTGVNDYQLAVSTGTYEQIVTLPTAPLQVMAGAQGLWVEMADGGWLPVTWSTAMAPHVPAPWRKAAEMVRPLFDDAAPFSNPRLQIAGVDPSGRVLMDQKMTLAWQGDLAPFGTAWPAGVTVPAAVAHLLAAGDTVRGTDGTHTLVAADQGMRMQPPWPGGVPLSVIPVGRWLLSGELQGALATTAENKTFAVGQLLLQVSSGSERSNVGDRFGFFYENGFHAASSRTLLDMLAVTDDQMVVWDQGNGTLASWKTSTGEILWEIH